MLMENKEILLGYYICKHEICPKFLNNISDRIISVSNCLCEHEPRITFTHGWKPNGDKKKYIDSLFMNREQYLKMSNEINDLFNAGLYLFDGRFLDYNDAKYFFDTYFDRPDYSLIAAVLDEKYLDAVKDDIPICKDDHLEGSYKHIGCDIIGWDFTGFHSFLCNSIHEDYPYLHFNEYGLVDEKYSDVEVIAEKIQGQGDLVDWFPVMICLCN